MASDMVANVRFNVAKTLCRIAPKLASNTVQGQIKPVLNKLNEDQDLTYASSHLRQLSLVRAKETNLKTGIVYGLRKPPQLLELFWKNEKLNDKNKLRVYHLKL